MIENCTNKKEINYPAEIIFKSIFRNRPYILDTIRIILAEHGVEGAVTARESSGAKFISYTVSGTFVSEEVLNLTCSKITMIEGFMSMF